MQNAKTGKLRLQINQLEVEQRCNLTDNALTRERFSGDRQSKTQHRQSTIPDFGSWGESPSTLIAHDSRLQNVDEMYVTLRKLTSHFCNVMSRSLVKA